MKDEIFLSYSSSNRKKAQLFAEALKVQGYSVWWDRKIPPGEKFDTFIQKKLNQAKCVIVLWSEDSVDSDWVKEEASDGENRDILIPALIDDILPPFGFRRIQAAKLVDWDGVSSHQEFGILLESVAGKLGQKSVTEKPKKQKAKVEPETITNSIGMQFKLIPAGEFMMGSEESDWSKPVHTITFYFGIFPVTQREWKAVMGDNPSHFKGDDLPVERVSWNEVQDFIKKLNEKEGTNKYRLPSEAEWEYAARAGTTTQYSFGDDESELGEYAWYVENSGSRSPKKGDYFGYDKDDWFENKWNGKTHPVGQKKSNPWGLYDMHGNVWEWVQDEWHDSYEGAPTDGSAWEDGSGAVRVFRGGGWSCNAGDCRSAVRSHAGPGARVLDLGFRLLKEL